MKKLATISLALVVGFFISVYTIFMDLEKVWETGADGVIVSYCIKSLNEIIPRKK